MSCDNFWHFWRNFGQKRSHHVMDVFCRLYPFPEGPRIEKIHSRSNAWRKPFPHARNVHSHLKFSFSVWNFHSRLKISIPGPVFLRSERGPEWKNYSRLKISFRIESLIFSILSLKIEFFQSWGPLGSDALAITACILSCQSLSALQPRSLGAAALVGFEEPGDQSCSIEREREPTSKAALGPPLSCCLSFPRQAIVGSALTLQRAYISCKQEVFGWPGSPEKHS